MSRRPPSDVQRRNYAATAANFTAWITTPEADKTLRLLVDARDGSRYPSRTSSAPRQPHNQVDTDGHPIPPDTPVESAALGHDPIEQQAAALLDDLAALIELTAAVARRFEGWRPSRTIEHYPCGHPVDRQYTRCQVIDPETGAQCGKGHTVTRSCVACGDAVEVGDYFAAGRCRSCHDKHRRKSRSAWFNAEGLQLSDATLISDIKFVDDTGTAHA